MAPVVLDYDGDGNVIGGHTVSELPQRRSSTQPPANMRAQDSTARLAPVGSGHPGEQYQQYQQPPAQNPEWSTYHRHSLPSGGRFVQPSPSMRPPDLPPQAHQGQLPAPPPHGAEQHAHFTRDSRDMVEYSDVPPAGHHGYVRNPVQFHAVQHHAYAPPPQANPSQMYYEPAGYQRGPDSVLFQHQQPLPPQHHAYMHPHQGYQAHYELPMHPQHHDGYSHRASYYATPGFQSQHAPIQHQQPSQYQHPAQHQHPAQLQHPSLHEHPSQHHGRRASSASSSRVAHPPAMTGHYESPYAATQEVPPQEKYREKASTKRKSSQVTAGHDGLPVVRKASMAGCPNVENVFFKSSRLEGSALGGDNEGEQPRSDDARSNRKEKSATKQANEKVAPAKSPSKAHAKKKPTKKSKKQSSVESLGRCTDCKKRHKKCMHLLKSRPDHGDHVAENLHTKPVVAGEDSRDQLPALAAMALQSTEQPLGGSSLKVSDADILALVPSEDVRGGSPSQSFADRDQNPASEDGEETEVQYEDFLRSQSPEDEGHVFHGHEVDESLPASATANLLNKLHAQLYDRDPLVIEAFNQDASKYRAANLSEQEFYVRTYKLFRRANATNLLPDFVKCLPLRQKQKQVAWLNDQAELEMAKEGALLAGNVQVISKHAMPKSTRKRRPKNGFKASESLEVRAEKDMAPDCEPSRTMFVRATPPGSPKTSSRAKSSDEMPEDIGEGDVESPAKQPPVKATKAQRPPGKTSSIKNPRDIERRSSAAPLTIKIKKSIRPKKVQYGHLFASEVEHVGPLYTTRREVLRRGTHPYVHNLCGQGFPHPQEVRAHHRAKKCHDDTSGQNWDEHPSCKADYPELNYTKVRDGYVILDQVSWDKLAAAVAAGENEPDRFRGREMKDKGTEETTEPGEEDDSEDSEDDAEHEMDEEFEVATPSISAKEATITPKIGTSASAVMPSSTPIQRKRAASNAGGRATKKVTVKAGSDETAVSGATEIPTKAPSLKKSTKNAASNAGGTASDDGSPAQLMARAAALGLRARF